MKYFHTYLPELTEMARKLRNNSTKAEIILWISLKGNQRQGFDFHRQKPIGRFILDFYCPKLQLGIEVDGSSHVNPEKDRQRELLLESYGIQIIRFSNDQILQHASKVIEIIDKWIIHHSPEIPHTPDPSYRGELLKLANPLLRGDKGVCKTI